MFSFVQHFFCNGYTDPVIHTILFFPDRRAAIDVKNKKGNSPLWLACNGGHLDVVQLLVNAKADVDSQDNRRVSCLMAAFRKGHVKVVKWLVKHVTQFPSDQECMRYIATITDKVGSCYGTYTV